MRELFDEFEYEYIEQGKYLEKKQKRGQETILCHMVRKGRNHQNFN